MIDVYLLPGIDGTGDLFDPLVACAPDWANPIVSRYDNTRAASYAELTDAVVDCIDTARPYLILGESFSGPVAIGAALARPEHLVGLVLSVTFARNPYSALALAPDGLTAAVIRTFLGTDARKFFLDLGHASDTLNAAARAAIDQVAAEVVLDRVRAIRDVDVSTELAAVDAPVLYLRATHDRVVPASALAHVRSTRPDVNVVEIDTSHLLLQTHPEDAWQAMAALASCRGEDPPPAQPRG
ncbi:MAG: alpha/beta hydrolase [Gammaproteobacteria bacterium]|nr:alpha/beta hydrolase [Gammaproteobacteria bacterium]